MLADVCGDNLATLWICIGEEVLDEVVAELISGDVNQRHASTASVHFADAIKVAIEEFGTSDFEAFLDNLGGELVHAVFRSITEDVLDGVSTVL